LSALKNDNSVREDYKLELAKLLKQRDFTIQRGLAELYASRVYNPQKVSLWLSRLNHSTIGIQLRDEKSSLRFKSLDHSTMNSLLYPNPSMGNILFLYNDVSKITFYNSAGSILLEFDNLLKNEEIDVSSFPKGIVLYSFLTKQKELKSGKILIVE
jgi:hypothetical protein